MKSELVCVFTKLYILPQQYVTILSFVFKCKIQRRLRKREVKENADSSLVRRKSKIRSAQTRIKYTLTQNYEAKTNAGTINKA